MLTQSNKCWHNETDVDTKKQMLTQSKRCWHNQTDSSNIILISLHFSSNIILISLNFSSNIIPIPQDFSSNIILISQDFSSRSTTFPSTCSGFPMLPTSDTALKAPWWWVSTIYSLENRNSVIILTLCRPSMGSNGKSWCAAKHIVTSNIRTNSLRNWLSKML